MSNVCAGKFLTRSCTHCRCHSWLIILGRKRNDHVILISAAVNTESCSLKLSYSTVVLYIGIMKVRGFWPKIIIPKPA